MGHVMATSLHYCIVNMTHGQFNTRIGFHVILLSEFRVPKVHFEITGMRMRDKFKDH